MALAVSAASTEMIDGNDKMAMAIAARSEAHLSMYDLRGSVIDVDSISCANEALHGRRDPIATDNNDRRLPYAITLLFPTGNEHMRASLQIGLAARDKLYNFGVLWDDNRLLAVLIFNLKGISLHFLYLLGDSTIGHRAIRHQVPRIVSFTHPAQRLLEHMHFDSFLGPIGLRHGGDADERVALNDRHRAFSNRYDRSDVLKPTIGLLPALSNT